MGCTRFRQLCKISNHNSDLLFVVSYDWIESEQSIILFAHSPSDRLLLRYPSPHNHTIRLDGSPSVIGCTDDMMRMMMLNYSSG